MPASCISTMNVGKFCQNIKKRKKKYFLHCDVVSEVKTQWHKTKQLQWQEIWQTTITLDTFIWSIKPLTLYKHVNSNYKPVQEHPRWKDASIAFQHIHWHEDPYFQVPIPMLEPENFIIQSACNWVFFFSKWQYGKGADIFLVVISWIF